MLDLEELTELCDAIQEDMAEPSPTSRPAMFAEPLDEAARAFVLHEILHCRPTTATAILPSQTLPDARAVLTDLALPTLLVCGAATRS